MKKIVSRKFAGMKFFLFIVALVLPEISSATNITFKDALLKEYIVAKYDTDADGEISQAEALKVDSIIVGRVAYQTKITNFSDLSKFPNLTYLSCSGNSLTALDVSENSALETLDCGNNQLTSLDLSKNSVLTHLNCHNNNLTTLDVSKNPVLTHLNCSNNNLTILNVSENPALAILYCAGNQLTSLDLSKNSALTDLDCSHNKLTSLDVSKNLALTSFSCYSNQLAVLNMPKGSALTFLSCDSNQLAALDVSENFALKIFYCSYNQLISLNVSKDTALTFLYCDNNKLTTLDVSENSALTNLQCSYNKLTSLDLSKNSVLKSLICGSQGYFKFDRYSYSGSDTEIIVWLTATQISYFRSRNEDYFADTSFSGANYLVTAKEKTAAIEVAPVIANFNISVQGSLVSVQGMANNSSVTVYNVFGKIVQTTPLFKGYASFCLPVNGMYIVKVGGIVKKVVIK